MITGGAGFIGSHVVRRFLKTYPNYQIVNFDNLTYAGNLENLVDVEEESNYVFYKGDICSTIDLEKVFNKYQITDVIHLAAESHVDRSISGPSAFVMTNIVGTSNLLNTAKQFWDTSKDHVFYHISTDEVYGSLGERGSFKETTPYDPRSPYSASKASSDHLARAFFHTFQLPIKISNCSNNYGSYQFPEKLIPLVIHNTKNKRSIPVYGDGKNIRDWLWVEDHASAIDLIFHNGKIGETYNIGGENEWSNLELVKKITELIDVKLKRAEGTSEQLITFVKDRAGHDRRYAIDNSKIKNELNWSPSINFEEGLNKTIDWYLANEKWLNNVTSGAYQTYYQEHYK